MIGIGLTTDETTLSYEFVFQALAFGTKKVTGTDFNPDVLVSDGDRAIRAGFFNVFGRNGKQSIMCYAHVMGNVQRKYKFADSSNNKDQVKADIRTLHLSQNEQTFDKGCELFIKKWGDKEKQVVQRLRESFFTDFKNWYIGVYPRVPKNNNALERGNAVIKMFQTDHKIKPLKQFIHDALVIIKQRSVSIPIDNITFETTVPIPNSVLLLGIHYKKPFVHRPAANEMTEFFVFRSGIEDEITLDHVAEFEAKQFESFDDFAEHAFDIHKITFPKNSKQCLEEGFCTCKSFDENFICKHIIGIAVQIGAINIPEKAKPNYDNEPLFQASRGRPKNPTPALDTQ